MTALWPDMVTIGKVERPFGVHGAVKVRSLSDRPGRFEQLHEVRMAGERGQTIDRRVRSVRKAGPVYIVEFEGITTPEEVLRVTQTEEHLAALVEDTKSDVWVHA